MNGVQQAELETLRREAGQMRGAALSHAAQPHPPADPYAHERYAAGPTRPPELPPLRSLQSPAGPSGPEAMTGVQYDTPRVNGYRPSEPARF